MITLGYIRIYSIFRIRLLEKTRPLLHVVELQFKESKFFLLFSHYYPSDCN